jgi:hypothetical protein
LDDDFKHISDVLETWNFVHFIDETVNPDSTEQTLRLRYADRHEELVCNGIVHRPCEEGGRRTGLPRRPSFSGVSTSPIDAAALPGRASSHHSPPPPRDGHPSSMEESGDMHKDDDASADSKATLSNDDQRASRPQPPLHGLVDASSDKTASNGIRCADARDRRHGGGMAAVPARRVVYNGRGRVRSMHKEDKDRRGLGEGCAGGAAPEGHCRLPTETLAPVRVKAASCVPPAPETTVPSPQTCGINPLTAALESGSGVGLPGGHRPLPRVANCGQGVLGNPHHRGRGMSRVRVILMDLPLKDLTWKTHWQRDMGQRLGQRNPISTVMNHFHSPNPN